MSFAYYLIRPFRLLFRTKTQKNLKFDGFCVAVLVSPNLWTGNPSVVPAEDKDRQPVKLNAYCYHPRTLAVLVFVLVCLTSVLAQHPAAGEQKPKTPAKETAVQDKKPATKPGFAWTIKTKPILNLSLKAEKASMAEVAQALSQRLKIPVFLGPERQNETDFD